MKSKSFGIISSVMAAVSLCAGAVATGQEEAQVTIAEPKVEVIVSKKVVIVDGDDSKKLTPEQLAKVNEQIQKRIGANLDDPIILSINEGEGKFTPENIEQLKKIMEEKLSKNFDLADEKMIKSVQAAIAEALEIAAQDAGEEE